MSLWFVRVFFLVLCSFAGMAIVEVRPELVDSGGPFYGLLFGFGFGGLLIAIDEMLKGISLRTFSATSFGLALGLIIAMLVDRSEIFENADHKTQWLIRLATYLGFGYIGIILAMRSNKEDFSLIIPYIRFSPQNKPDNLIVLDTSVIIDGRVADLVESGLIEGMVVVPRFVLKELQLIGDSNDPLRRARGRRGLEMLNRLQRMPAIEVKIHDGDFSTEREVDAKLVQFARHLKARLFTNDFNLCKIAELQSVKCVNMHDAAKALKTVMLPGEVVHLKIVRDGKEKDQGVGYLPDGTMVVVNQGRQLIGHDVEVEVQSLLQTGAGVIVFADRKNSPATAAKADLN